MIPVLGFRGRIIGFPGLDGTTQRAQFFSARLYCFNDIFRSCNGPVPDVDVFACHVHRELR